MVFHKGRPSYSADPFCFSGTFKNPSSCLRTEASAQVGAQRMTPASSGPSLKSDLPIYTAFHHLDHP